MPAVEVAEDAESVRREPTAGPRGTLWFLRVISLVHTAVLVGQPVLAGRYLDGDFDALAVHGLNGSLLPLVTLVQAIAALAYCWAGRGRGWPMMVSLVLFLTEGYQIGAGYSRELAIHIPLGVAIVVGQLLLTVWLFRRSARGVRSWGRRAGTAGTAGTPGSPAGSQP